MKYKLPVTIYSGKKPDNQWRRCYAKWRRPYQEKTLRL